jgi:hypothetical protein
MSLRSDVRRLRALRPPGPPLSDAERLLRIYEIGVEALERLAAEEPDMTEIAHSAAAFLAEVLALAREGVTLGGPNCARRVGEQLDGLSAGRWEIVPGQTPAWHPRTAEEKLCDLLHDDGLVDDWRKALEADRREAGIPPPPAFGAPGEGSPGPEGGRR